MRQLNEELLRQARASGARKHHIVPKFYLASWADDRGLIRAATGLSLWNGTRCEHLASHLVGCRFSGRPIASTLFGFWASQELLPANPSKHGPFDGASG